MKATLQQWRHKPTVQVLVILVVILAVVGGGASWLQRAGATQRAAGAIYEYKTAQALPKTVAAKLGKLTRQADGTWVQDCSFKYRNHKFTYEYIYVPKTRRVTCNVYRDSWAIADNKAPFRVVPQLK